MTEARQKGLGRRHAPDSRDALYPIRLLMKKKRLPTSRFFRSGLVLDQGATSSCVGHAWRQFLSSAPLMTKAGPDAFKIWNDAKAIDEWTDTNPGDEEGTSVRAGVKVLQSLGHIASYVWAFSAGDCRDFILGGFGPLVFGTWWYGSMFDPDPAGFVTISGSPIGGHAYFVVGYSTQRDAFRCVNSWGREWGQSGRFWLPFDLAHRLIQEDGEACAATEMRLVPIA
jgi:hypothetical protein